MRVRVGGVEFDNVTMDETVARIVSMARQTGRPRLVCTGNLDHMVTLQSDPEFVRAYEAADLVLADGMPIVWVSRLCQGGPLRERVAGSDLFWELAKVSADEGLRLFFLGGSPGSAERAAEAARLRYPGIRISGIYCPPFETFGAEEEQASIRETIRRADPHILLVALGAPKQEKWVLATRDAIRVPVSIGVGGSFEMAGGVIRRAPVWMQKSGLEWVHRLLQEPGRMWNRYVRRNLPFFFRLLVLTLAARGRKNTEPRASG
jgi:N-acetylglucosaminyldiphosphoundecaprenol N-acetyl-beta-D-mannosaminyltransferase